MDSIEKFLNEQLLSLVLLNAEHGYDLKILVENEISKITQLQTELKTPHVWIASSGSQLQDYNSLCVYALSRHALLTSAQAVNEHLHVTSKDLWLNPLPLFHVGGLGIIFRGFVSGNRVIHFWQPNKKWNPVEFMDVLQNEKVTLTSLVPTQVYDLVQRKLTAPHGLRAVIVGGARLNDDLYLAGRKLGWPLLPSYGMTEFCSQIATAELKSLLDPEFKYPEFKVLNHVQVQLSDQEPYDTFFIKGKSLYSGKLLVSEQNSTWQRADQMGYLTHDRGELKNGYLKFLGRSDEIVKVMGENADLNKLRNLLESLKVSDSSLANVALVAIQDPRRGYDLGLVYTSQTTSESVNHLMEKFNLLVLPFERLSFKKKVLEIPRSDLGKILYAKIPL